MKTNVQHLPTERHHTKNSFTPPIIDMGKYFILFLFLLLTYELNAQSTYVLNGRLITELNGKCFSVTNGDTTYIGNQYITIKHKDNQFEKCKSQLTSIGLKFRDRPSKSFSIFQLPGNTKYIETIARIEKLASVQYCIPDLTGHQALLPPTFYPTNDPLPNSSPSGNDIFWFGSNDEGLEPKLRYLNIDGVWQLTKGNPSVKIAIIDNGVGWGSADMPSNNYLGKNFVDNNNNTQAVCGPSYSGNQHGSVMTSIICAKTNNATGNFGVAGGWTDNGVYTPGVTPMALVVRKDPAIDDPNFFGAQTMLAHLPSAIRYAADNGAKVILIPLAFFNLTEIEKEPTKQAIDEVLADLCNPLTIVAAAGNSLHTAVPDPDYLGFPASYTPVISVSGATADHELYDGEGYQCHYGANLDFVAGVTAPGIHGPCVESTFYYGPKTGSSVAAALLAGSIGLMYSIYPDLTSMQIMELLKSACYVNPIYPTTNGWSPKVGYGFPDIRKAIDNYELISTEITTTQWNSDRVSGNIHIEANNTLTFNNITLTMLPHSKIIIKPGGKLIVNNSTITTCPNKTWKGIQVWGKISANQFPNAQGKYQQGYLELNNSTIEYAICAADLWKPGDYKQTGGILKATNSNFINNTTSVHANHYKNTHPNYPQREMDYVGLLINCTFQLNSNYIPTNTFYKHVDIADVKGFVFRGCDFTLAPNAQGVSYYSHAIAAYSAGFKADAICTSATSPCSTWDHCSFTGFYKAINATDPFTKLRTFTVNNALFNNNKQGVYASNIGNATVINSLFNIGHTPNGSGCTTNASYGINLEYTSGFALEDNIFNKYTGAPTGVYNGINVTYSDAVNQIYRNTFNGLSYANLAQLKNWATIPEGNYTQGLTYFCNTNTNNYADFYVVPDDDNTKISGIEDGQGSDSEVAGNTFSQSASTRWHIYNGGDFRVGYYYNANQPNQNPYDHPDPAISKIFYVTESPEQLNNSCPSHYGGGGGISIKLSTAERTGKELEFAQALTNYNNVKSLFDNLKDGGSTTGTLTDIGSAEPDEMWTLRGELLGASPHLSIEVLKAVANRTDVFPHSAIFDILAANPDELRKNELLDYLATTTDPLPEYMINILRSVAEGSSYKTVLLGQMAQYNRLKTNAAYDIIRSILNSDETDYNDLRNWLDNLGGPEADRQIIASYISENNFTAALSLATMQPQLYTFDANEVAANDALIQLINLYQTLYNEDRHLDALTQAELTMINDMASMNPSEARGIARGILSAYYGATYEECFELPELAAYKKGEVTPEVYADIYRMEIAVNPNPASTWAAFEYRLPDFESTGLLEITDIAGHKVLSVELHDAQGQYLLDTRPLNIGMYLYSFTSGKARKTGKFAVVK